MSAASLSLLKGGKKDAVEDELETEKVPETATADAGEEVVETTVDPDKMTGKELDALVKEFEIETPDTWSKMKVEEKRQWLKSQFEEAPADEAPAEETVVEAKTETVAAETPATTPTENLEPKTDKKAKGKSVAKSTAKSGEIQTAGEDVLSDLIHEIETMKEKDAKALVRELSEHSEQTFFKLGGVLSLIQANGWYEPYASFREYVEKEHGLHYRKATYWVGIYNNLAESKVPWAKVKDIGWTKLKEIAAVITVDNVDEWVKIASEQNTITLIETVKNHLAKDAPKGVEDQSSKTVTTKTFKVHEDQKAVIDAALEKAKSEGATTVDTVALEYICSDFLAAQTLTQKFQKMGIEAALEALEKAFPTATIEVTIGEEAA